MQSPTTASRPKRCPIYLPYDSAKKSGNLFQHPTTGRYPSHLPYDTSDDESSSVVPSPPRSYLPRPQPTAPPEDHFMMSTPIGRNSHNFDPIPLPGSTSQKSKTQEESQITCATWDSEAPSTPHEVERQTTTATSRREQRTRPSGKKRIWVFGYHVSRTRFMVIVALIGWILTFVSGLLVGGKFLSLSASSHNHISSCASTSTSSSHHSGMVPSSNITVGAYYYPWSYRGNGTLRELLGQIPTLGYYDASDQQTVTQHLAWSRQANIQLWVTSWRGPHSSEDTTIRSNIFSNPLLGDHKIALFYETWGRIQEVNSYSTQYVSSDIEYICQSYFDHPNYFTINGRPVLFVYLTRKLQALGLMTTVIDLMRGANCGNHTLYIVGDQVFGQAPESKNLTAYQPFELLDAVTNYDVYGSMGIYGYAGEQDVINYYQHDELGWRQQALAAQCGFVPSVAAGYNDLGVRPEAHHAPLSRRLTSNSSPEGSLFQVSLEQARLLVDPAMNNLLMVTSFNEWHEDTQIEPCVGKASSLPDTLTHGLEYEGYGELYLDILRETTSIEGESAGI